MMDLIELWVAMFVLSYLVLSLFLFINRKPDKVDVLAVAAASSINTFIWIAILTWLGVLP